MACGVRRGERVLLLADSCPEWGAVCLATQLIGAVLVTAFSSASSEVCFVKEKDERMVGVRELMFCSFKKESDCDCARATSVCFGD